VVNRIVVRGRDQVMLKVTVAEVQRDVVKQLGVDVNGSFSYGTAVVNFNTDNPFSINQQPISGTAISAQGAINPLTGMPRIGATIRAMERAGIVRLLAEPTLTAISGESATFLAGGEFPFPIPQAGTPPTIGIEFKQFGVSLTFTPVVLSEGRISMKVLTEVSELSSEGGVTVLGTTVPSLRVRRADTTLEIPSGGTLAMAGMIREQTRQAINGLPGLMQIPVLGTLFKSRDFVNNQTELMVLVTPYIVRAVAQKDLSRPDDGYADASDPASNFLARLNRIYGVPARRPEPVGGWRATFGFILD
jgi:pilus assembly protein CpaC